MCQALATPQGLIVDFPKRRCVATNKKTKKSVQFSATSQMVVVDRIDDTEASSVWYSHQEYKAIREANKQAVINLHQNYESLSSRQDLLDELTGIENLVSLKTIKKIQGARISCINAVLEESQKQKTSGDINPDRLASVSEHYSKSASKRAQSIGKLHSRIAGLHDPKCNM